MDMTPMSGQVDFAEIVEAIRNVGVQRGDLVMVHSRLFSIGLVAGISDVSAMPAVYLRAFQEVLGDSGTLVVPTFTTSFGRYGKPFVYEESPSEMGVFSETVRRTPGSCRTLHPVQSLTALGALAEELTRDHPRWNVGYDTIWDRMHRRGGKTMTVGIPFRQGLSFVHHVEFLACVPYLYHKLLRGNVSAGGVRIAQDFFMPVRYLRCGIAYNLSRLEADMSAAAAVHRAPLGGEWIQMIPLQHVFDICMQGLRQDPYYLLQQPPTFVDGEIPCDGITSGREEPVPSYYRVVR